MQPQLENGYARIANEILEELSSTYLSPYEWQVLMFIFRKTYGFGKKSDWIANSQLVSVTGIHKAHISRTIKKLKDRNIVTQTGNKISFNKNYSSWLPKQATNKKLPKQATPVTQIGILELPKQADTKETITKETIQKKYTSIKNLTEKDFEEIANDYEVTIQFVRSKFEDLKNYCEAKNKRYSNYKSALRNFVKKAFEEKGGKLKMPTEELEIKRQQLNKQFGF